MLKSLQDDCSELHSPLLLHSLFIPLSSSDRLLSALGSGLSTQGGELFIVQLIILYIERNCPHLKLD